MKCSLHLTLFPTKIALYFTQKHFILLPGINWALSVPENILLCESEHVLGAFYAPVNLTTCPEEDMSRGHFYTFYNYCFFANLAVAGYTGKLIQL